MAETEEHELLRQTVRQFTATRVESQAMAHDQSCTFNTKLLLELGKLGLIGIPVPMFTVLFAMGRLPGWISHWLEMHQNKNTTPIETAVTLLSPVLLLPRFG